MTCPDPETFAQLAEGRLPEFSREALLEHLASCDSCRAAALLVVPEKRATERRVVKRRSGFAWAPWAAAAVALLAFGIVWKKLPRREASRSPEVSKVKTPEPEPAPLPKPETPKP